MRVLLVSSGSGSRGGGEIYLTLLARGLEALGCEVKVAIPQDPAMDELSLQFAPAIQIERFPYKSTYKRKLRGVGAILDGTQKRAMAAFFKQQQPDIIHINQQVAEDGLDLVMAAKQSGLPWVSTIHVGRSASSLNAKLGAFRDAFTHRILNAQQGQFITVSDASRTQLQERMNTTTARFDVVHNGVLTPTKEVIREGRDRARAEWEVDLGDIVVGAVGRIEPQKNPLALIEHVRNANLGDRVKVVWIGDGSLRTELEAFARSQNVRLRIDGWRNDAATRIAGLDVFVLPSKFEGLPLAILESMHAGVPVIAVNADGIPEAIENGVTGILCHTPCEWPKAISSLVLNSALREQFAEAAQKKAKLCFSELSMARSTIALYRSTVEA